MHLLVLRSRKFVKAEISLFTLRLFWEREFWKLTVFRCVSHDLEFKTSFKVTFEWRYSLSFIIVFLTFTGKLPTLINYLKEVFPEPCIFDSSTGDRIFMLVFFVMYKYLKEKIWKRNVPSRIWKTSKIIGIWRERSLAIRF